MKADEYCKKTRDVDKKFLFIADMSGKLPTFMTYAAEYELFDFGSQVKKVIITKTQSAKDVQEISRKFMVNKMRTGQ